jgi:hypothetical protein
LINEALHSTLLLCQDLQSMGSVHTHHFMRVDLAVIEYFITLGV